MSAPDRKRVFILGAGFSKAAGMPDAYQLTDLLIKAAFRGLHGSFQAWADDFQRRINLVNQQENQGVNIEQFFDLAPYDITLFRLQQQRQRINVGDVPGKLADNIAAWLRRLEDYVSPVLMNEQLKVLKTQPSPVPEWMNSFASSLKNGDTVLTFNYDTLLECALTVCGTTWSHGFDAETPGQVTVLKLHGSIDWFLVPRENQHGCKMLFEVKLGGIYYNDFMVRPESSVRIRDTVLVRAPDLETAGRVLTTVNEPPGVDPPAYTYPEPGLAGLGAHKPLDHLIGSATTWHNALAGLRETDEIYVVGWSASPYDTMARFYFTSVLNLPEPRPRRVVIVDPKVCDQITNYKAIFKDVESIGQYAQHVDWCSLLGG